MVRMKCRVCGYQFEVAKEDDAPGSRHPGGPDECLREVGKRQRAVERQMKKRLATVRSC